MKCPYCGEDLKEWDRRLYCENMACSANHEDLPRFIWQDLIDGKKAQRQLRTIKDRCVKKIKAKECEIESYLNGISVRQSENERLAKQLKQAREALDVAKYAFENIKDDMEKEKDGDDIRDIQKNLHDYCEAIINKITQQDTKEV